MNRVWLFLPLVALLLLVDPQNARTAPAELDPAYQRILDQEKLVMTSPTDPVERQKLIDVSVSEDRKSLVIVGVGVQEKGKHPKQALLLAQRAAQTDVYRWLAYHAAWQTDTSINFGTIEANITLKGQLLFQGTTPDGTVILVQQFPYPLKVKVTPKPTPTPTVAPSPAVSPSAAPTPAPTALPTMEPSPPAASPMSISNPTPTPPVAPTPMASPTPAPVVSPAETASPAPSPSPATSPVPQFRHIR